MWYKVTVMDVKYSVLVRDLELTVGTEGAGLSGLGSVEKI